MEKTLRLFIAVPLPDSVKAQICAGPLSSAALNRPGIRPVPANNLHLTLRFLGDTAESKLPAIREAIETAAAGLRPFRAEIQSCGVFPNPAAARVFWLGFDPRGAARLRDVAKSVAGQLARAGIDGDRKPFRPHMTLARVNAGTLSERETAAIVTTLREVCFDPVPVREICCFSSDLSGRVPVYKKRFSAAFER